MNNKKFYSQIGFVVLAILSFIFLQATNKSGQYDELIIGIIGIFIGSAQSAATQLLGKDEDSENVKNLKDENEKLNIELGQANQYKTMFIELQSKLIDSKIIIE